ncbi:hypothetical protein [Marinomonas sp. 2405UD68-3]|uniref:hypothetical protein n=1 Tax=Marinomonas sp. 2405UD68-3 TaxID=3391835 RepID=UPI0039C8D1DF
MSLRMEARKYQLTVQLMQVNIPDKWDKTTISIASCAYRLNRIKELKTLEGTIRMFPNEVWKHALVCDGWWSNAAITLSPEAISNLAIIDGSVDCIEISSNSVTCFWKELGDDKSVKALAELLQELQNIR